LAVGIEARPEVLETWSPTLHAVMQRGLFFRPTVKKREEMMKAHKLISLHAVLGLLVTLMLAPSISAKSRKSLTVYEKARLNNVVLEPGNYKVEVEENGSAAQVMIYKGNKVVTKATAQAEKLEKKADRNSVRMSLEDGKAPNIIELRLAGEAQAYKFENAEKQVSQKAEK
jgi:hypothetical protein